MYKTKLTTEEQNLKDFYKTIKGHKNDFIKAGFDEVVPITQSRLNDQTYSLLTPSGKRIAFPDYYLISKGVAIRNAIHTILKDHKPTKEDIVIGIDGDGQIPYKTIFIVNSLLKNYDFIVSCRGNKSGMADSERIKIEHFENFLLTNKFGYPPIPDAQCGCWGFRGNYIKNLNSCLKAISFEVELDLLGYFLNEGITPCINYVEIKEDLDTTWNDKEHKNKLISLARNYELDQEYLLSTFQKFIQKFNTNLPPKYMSFLTSYEIPKKRNDIVIEDPKKIKYPLKNCNCDKTKLPSSHVCFKRV